MVTCEFNKSVFGNVIEDEDIGDLIKIVDEDIPETIQKIELDKVVQQINTVDCKVM